MSYRQDCETCGKRVETWNYKARFCSVACKQKAYRDRKRTARRDALRLAIGNRNATAAPLRSSSSVTHKPHKAARGPKGVNRG